MATDNSVKEAASTAAGAAAGGIKKTLSFIWDRVNFTKATGLLATTGFLGLLVGGAWLFAPQAMAAVPTLTVPTGAGVGAKMSTIASNVGSHVWAATEATIKGTGNLITTTDWSGLAHNVSNLGGAASGTPGNTTAPALQQIMPGPVPGDLVL